MSQQDISFKIGAIKLFEDNDEVSDKAKPSSTNLEQ